MLVVAAVNPLFSAMGSTELFRIGLRAVYLESLAYGLCMGMLLVSVVLWFSNASHVLTSDKVMGLFGNVAPVIALMLSMAARLVPRFRAPRQPHFRRAGRVRARAPAHSARAGGGARAAGLGAHGVEHGGLP